MFCDVCLRHTRYRNLLQSQPLHCVKIHYSQRLIWDDTYIRASVRCSNAECDVGVSQEHSRSGQQQATSPRCLLIDRQSFPAGNAPHTAVTCHRETQEQNKKTQTPTVRVSHSSEFHSSSNTGTTGESGTRWKFNETNMKRTSTARRRSLLRVLEAVLYKYMTKIINKRNSRAGDWNVQNCVHRTTACIKLTARRLTAGR